MTPPRANKHGNDSNSSFKTEIHEGKEDEDNIQEQREREDIVGDVVSSSEPSSILNELTMQQRSQIEHEIHGVAKIYHETPAIIQQKLEEMSRALSNLTSTSFPPITGSSPPGTQENYQQLMQETPLIEQSAENEDTSDYIKALTMSKDYVERLKILFLRAECYNSLDAASRMIRFFKFKKSLFGEQLLVQDIQQQDLNPKDIDALEKGLVQLLPHRDRAGRAVLLLCGKVNQHIPENDVVLRVLFYVKMMALQDIEVQKRGIVAIYYGFGQRKTVAGRPEEFWRSWNSVPARIVSCHLCGEDNLLKDLFREFSRVAERTAVCRFRYHYGPPIECMHNLTPYGILVRDSIPLTADGSIDLSMHLGIMKIWKYREENAPSPIRGQQYQEDEVEESQNDDSGSGQATVFGKGIFDTGDNTTTNTSPDTRESDEDLFSRSIEEEIYVTGKIRQDFLEAPDMTMGQHNKKKDVDCDENYEGKQDSSLLCKKGGKGDSTSLVAVAPIAALSSGAGISISAAATPTNVTPGEMDILLGRGRSPRSSPGTLKFHNLVVKNAQKYEAASKFEKTVISETILGDLKSAGCRFLKLTPSGFEVCDDTLSRGKIAHAFRNLKAKEAKLKNRLSKRS